MKYKFLITLTILFITSCGNEKTGIRGNTNNDNNVVIGDENEINIYENKKDINRAPKNVIQELNLNSSFDYLKHILGPHKEIKHLNESSSYIWKFDNLEITVSTFKDEVDYITYKLPDNSTATFPMDDFLLKRTSVNIPNFGDLDYRFLFNNLKIFEGKVDPISSDYGFYHCFENYGISYLFLRTWVLDEFDYTEKKDELINQLNDRKINYLSIGKCEHIVNAN